MSARLARLDESIPSTLRNIEFAVRRIIGFLEENCDCRELEKIQVALREAVSNAVLHGNHGDPEKSVRFIVEIEEGGGIIIVVKDSGSGFDPDKLPDPTEGDNIYRETGRGVYLMRQLMDRIEYQFGEGTSLIMHVHPPQRPGAG